MNLPFFVSHRIAKTSAGSFSLTVNRIAVITIGLGLAVLILAFMILHGFKEEIKRKIYTFSGHLIVTKYTLSTSFEETSITVNDSLLRLVNAYGLTTHVQPFAMKAGLLKTEEEVQGVLIKGVDSAFDTAAFSEHLIDGYFPDFSADGYSTEVVISNKIARYLKLKVSDEILIYFVQNPPRFRKLQVRGIYETGLEEFDEKVIIGDLALIRRINNWPDSLAGGLEIFISNEKQLEKAELDLFNTVGIDLYVDKVSDRFVQLFDWLNLLNRNVVILLAIILFIAISSIISVMIILIMERTSMIGILKALGAGDSLIRKIFIWNGIRLVSGGLMWGNFIGVSMGALQYYLQVIPLNSANYYMDYVPVKWDVLTILGLNGLVLVVMGLTLFIPVRIISRIQPIKTIRFD